MRNVFLIIIIGFAILFIITPKTLADDTTNPSLSDAVYADLALKGYLDNISISFYDGNKSDNIAINDAKHWLPASTVKLFVAMYAYKQIADSKLSLYQTIPIESKNVVPIEYVSDELPEIQEGSYLTVDRLIKQMITQSDNTAYNVLLDVLDRNKITEYIHSLGLDHTSIGSKLNLDTSQEQYEFDVPGYGINTTTSDDYTKAFTLIWKNKIADAKPLLGVLKQQRINNMLPLLLPKNVSVAHKHGDLDPLFHDGGIVFGPKTSYVVSIFSNAGDPNLVAHISELIYTKDFNLVGKTARVNKPTINSQTQPLDPLLAEGNFHSAVLASNTNFIFDQPITAADLGITAKDLSLTEVPVNLPKVVIPADSYWHGLVDVWQLVKEQNIFNLKSVANGYIDQMRLQVSEAKDLLARGKTQEASVLLNDVQNKMTVISKSKVAQNDASIQIALQGVSEARFSVLGESLVKATGSRRNELIREIGQQAKNTLASVHPNIPLAINATNPTQRPLIGEVVDKTDTKVVVKTAGGQQLEIPLTDQTPTVKTRQISFQITPTPLSSASSETITITPKVEEKSLTAIPIGTTVALIGSSIGNSFTPTFVMTHVPKELAAAEPVSVVKVNKVNKTMVISENGVPVQVNVSDNTIIRGKDTSINFNSIKTGDVVVVHGEPLVPVVLSPTPVITRALSPTVKISPILSATPIVSFTPSVTVSSNQSKVITPTKDLQPSRSTSTPTQVVQKGEGKGLQPKVTQSIPVQKSDNKAAQLPVQPPAQPQAQPQPKVIQSTSIQVIQKSENKANQPPAQIQAQPQPQSQPKPDNKPAAPETPKSPPPPVVQPDSKTKVEDKK